LGSLVTENRRPIHDFTTTGLYDLTALVAQLRELTSNISRITTRLERDPGAFLFGDTRKGLQVK
jgi:phospholipid/cholesterol/gamma-HCH transport system substrate-binding protein